MFVHLTPRNPFCSNLNTIKVDALGVQNGTAVNRESDTLNLGGTLLGLRLVFDSDLGFLRFKERVVDLTFVVLSLPHQFTFQTERLWRLTQASITLKSKAWTRSCWYG
jgi:hypothetical protein